MKQSTQFDNHATAQSTLLKGILASRRHIQLYASLIDPALFNSTESTDAFSYFARSSKYAHLEVIIEDPKLFALRNPKFLALVQRLTDRIEIRSIPQDLRHGTESFMVCDQATVWHIPNIEYLSGHFSDNDRITASKFTEQFLYMWERSKTPTELRRLNF
ncbi:MAG: hypothetical protein KUG75_01025 [Pseudomonadales bacterium]|nr:hypothetical protein [Pseudomonadales bacterium]